MNIELLTQSYVAMKTSNIEASKNEEFVRLFTNDFQEIENLEAILFSESSVEVEIHKEIIEVVGKIRLKIDFLNWRLEVNEDLEREFQRAKNVLGCKGIYNWDKKEIVKLLKSKGFELNILTKESLKPYRDDELITLLIEALNYENKIELFKRLEGATDEVGIIKPKYHLYGSLSGRITSYNPNVQSLPKEYKKYVLPLRNGDKVYELDVKCSELIALAYLSKESLIFDLLLENTDPYTYVALKIFPNYKGEVTKEMRKCFKALINGINLGMGNMGIMDLINKQDFVQKKINLDGAKEVKARYFQIVPNIENFLIGKEKVTELKTILGHTHKVSPSYKNLSFFGQNLISSTLKLTLKELKGYADVIVNIVHDSIWVSCNERELLEIKAIMEESFGNGMLPKEYKEKGIELVKVEKIGG